jgi:PKD repeat protein
VRAIVVAGLLLAAALAGCSGETEDGLPSGTGSSTSGSASGSLTNATTGSNAPPTANLTADLSNGTAPLAVNFTVGGSDPDGDNLTWALAVNGTPVANGTGVPASASHLFNATGNWTVVLTVSDGELNATASVNVTVLGGLGARVPVLLAEYTNSGTIFGAYVLTNDPMWAHLCPGFNAGQDGLGCVFLEFPAGSHDGAPAIVTTDAANFRMAFFPECGDPAATGVGFASGAPGDAIVVPAGAGCGVAWSSNTGDWPQERSFTLSVYDWLPDDEE